MGIISKNGAETLVPETVTLGSGTTSNAWLLYDGDDSTHASLGSIEDSDAQIRIEAFPADSYPNARQQVLVRVLARFASNSDDYDRCLVYFRETPVASWVTIADVDRRDALFAIAPKVATWVEFDVTTQAGSNPSSGFAVGLQFYNGSADNPTAPSFDL